MSKLKLFLEAIVIATGIGALVASVPLAVIAEDTPNSNQVQKLESQTQEQKTKQQKREQDVREKEGKVSARERKKLDAKKQELCKQREEAMKKRTNAIQNGSIKQLQHMNNVFERVRKFVDNRKLQVIDYNAQVVAVEVAKNQAVAEIDTIKNSLPTLNCDVADHREEAKALKDGTKRSVQSLKNYRNVLHSFIKVVKDAAKAQLPTEAKAQP